jgi:hypothetical protein
MSEERISLTSPAVDPNPGEQGYVPPTEAVPLPSEGKIYPPDSPLHKMEVVEIRSMTARDEDILTSKALLKQGKAIDTLLRSCMLNKGIDAGQMVGGDRNAILVAIRVTGYGAEYKTQIECPKCDAKVDHSFDLSSLKVKPLGKDPVSPGMNAFECDLPVSKKKAIYKILTGQEEKDLGDLLERSRKNNNESPVTARLLMSLVSVNGETDRNKLAQFVRNMPAGDSRVLRRDIDKTAPGVDMNQVFECPQCSEESEVTVPIGTEFFWPDA